MMISIIQPRDNKEREKEREKEGKDAKKEEG